MNDLSRQVVSHSSGLARQVSLYRVCGREGFDRFYTGYTMTFHKEQFKAHCREKYSEIFSSQSVRVP